MFLAALVNTSMISYRDLREFDVFLPKLPPKTLEKLQMLGQVLGQFALGAVRCGRIGSAGGLQRPKI